MTTKTRIVYIEDLRIVREAVNYLLARQANLEILQELPDPEKISDYVHLHQPKIAIIDLQLANPDDPASLNGFAWCERLREADPDMKLIAHSVYDSVEYANKFFSKGGHAFVSKKAGHLELLEAIEAVQNGRRYIDHLVGKKAKNTERFLRREDEQLKAIREIFTKTEKNVLERIAKGYSTKQIAHQLGVSEKTVETHRKHLFDKAGVKNVAELIAFVFSRRIVME
jgi:DNA-binding NarL/FixJ family response regulator